MDNAALTRPRIPDRDSLLEFSEALSDLIPQLERHVASLKQTPDSRDAISALFRGMHTIKGDAAMCKIDVGVMIAHPIETLLARVREGEIAFTDLIAEVVLLALDRLELTIESLTTGRNLSGLKLPELIGGLELMGKSTAALLPTHAIDVIQAVTGFRPSATSAQAVSSPQGAPANRDGDMMFFLGLALHYEAFSPLFQGRSGRQLHLALNTNAEAGNPVNPTQLEAAIYVHDIGMMFLPESVWLKTGLMSDDELARLHRHPDQSAGLLARIPGWADAAQMVAQHHEMQNGRGYPLGLKGSDICPGAKILAIVDAFEAVTLKQSHRGQNRSLLRAIAEINACDNQFDAGWIAHFNQVIRRTLEA
jgi:HPt (histidine-containing phosphotransfer) domain-containing protein